MPNDSFHLCIEGLKECAINTTASIVDDSLYICTTRGVENQCRVVGAFGATQVFWQGLCGVRVSLGPLHTRAKSRDHEIVRAQKRVPKRRLKSPPSSCRVVTDPQV